MPMIAIAFCRRGGRLIWCHIANCASIHGDNLQRDDLCRLVGCATQKCFVCELRSCRLGGITAPTAIGFLNKTGSESEWANVFYLAAAVNVIAGIAFLGFGSGFL